jgi:hypothetical protein
VLQSGHAADILVRLVEKPTDNPPARSFCYPRLLTDSPEAISPALAPGAFPNIPSTRLGPRGYFDGTHRSRC